LTLETDALEPGTPLNEFLSQVVKILTSSAKDKGYSDGEVNVYKNELMGFTSKNFPGHALGEIVYKAIRYRSKHNPQDLVKIAAWAALQYLEDTNESKISS